MVTIKQNNKNIVSSPSFKGAGDLAKMLKTVPIEAYSIPVISGYQIFDDFKHAGKGEKKRTLVKDALVIAATCLGAYGANKATGKFLTKKLSPLKEEIVKFISIPLGGLISGIIAGETAEIILPSKNLALKKTAKEAVKETIEEEKQNAKNKINSEELIDDEIQAKEKAQTKPKRRKKHRLLKSLIIMSATCLGVIAGNAGAKKAISKLSLKETENLIGTAGILAGGFASNIFSRKILNIIFPEKSEIEEAKDSLKGVSVSYGVISDNLDELFNNTFSTLKGFSIGRQDGLESKVKKGFYEIISGIIIPTAVILPATTILKKKVDGGDKAITELIDALKKINKYNPSKALQKKIMTDTNLQKNIIKKTLIFPITIASLYLGHSIGNWFNQRITDQILKKEMWDEVIKARENLMKNYLNSMSTNDEAAQKEALKSLAKVKDIEKIVKPDEVISKAATESNS